MVFCLLLFACMHVQSRRCFWFCDPMDCSPLGSSVRRIFSARILERIAISSSKEFSWPRDQTCISCTGRWILYHWATWEAYLIVELLNYRICKSTFWPFPLGRDYLCSWPVSGIFNILVTLRLVFSFSSFFPNWGIVYLKHYIIFRCTVWWFLLFVDYIQL